MQSAECRIEVKVSIIPNSAFNRARRFSIGPRVEAWRNVWGGKEMKGIAFAKEFRDVLQSPWLKICRGGPAGRRYRSNLDSAKVP